MVHEEYAVSSDGMRMFGVMDLSSGFDGCRLAIGLRNSHDKSFRLSCTVGLRVFVCENLAFHGEYAPSTKFLNPRFPPTGRGYFLHLQALADQRLA